jgi:hypothetical protein
MKKENNSQLAENQQGNKQKTHRKHRNTLQYFLTIMQVTQTTDNLLSHLDAVK